MFDDLRSGDVLVRHTRGVVAVGVRNKGFVAHKSECLVSVPLGAVRQHLLNGGIDLGAVGVPQTLMHIDTERHYIEQQPPYSGGRRGSEGR